MKDLIKISEQNRIVLNQSIFFFNMQELRRRCEGLRLPKAGVKISLISRIMTFLTTGDIVLEPEIPAASRAQKGETIIPAPKAKMLFGAYKNDAVTRAFFKKIIGEHFHYTAFGVDWLKERWLMGKPPTFGEFAKFWQEETLARKKNKAPLKKEWALLNFVLAYIKKFPQAEREEVTTAWKQERSRQVARGMEILRPIVDEVQRKG